jgi:hypothetical protein
MAGFGLFFLNVSSGVTIVCIGSAKVILGNKKTQAVSLGFISMATQLGCFEHGVKFIFKR